MGGEGTDAGVVVGSAGNASVQVESGAEKSAGNPNVLVGDAVEESAGNSGVLVESNAEKSEEELGASKAKEEEKEQFIPESGTDAGTVDESAGSLGVPVESGGEESKEASDASQTEKEEKVRRASESGTPAAQASGVTWTVDGDTMTISGEGTKDTLSDEFWTTLRSTKSIRFANCKITGSMEAFFKGISATNIDCSGLDTSGVTDMNSMFSDCRSLTSLNVSGWNTENVTDMGEMFRWCAHLRSLDVSGWDTGNVTDMSHMFDVTEQNIHSSSGLRSLDVSEWDTGNVTDMSYMFGCCGNLTYLDVSGWDTGNVMDMSGMFWNCTYLTYLDVSEWDTGNVMDMSYMFNGSQDLTSLDVSEWNTGNVTTMRGMFGNCNDLTDFAVSEWDTGNVTDMSWMFSHCYGLASLDVSKWDTGNVTSMQRMFWYSGLRHLNASGWDTGNVTDMSLMFHECDSLASLDVSGWNTENVTTMQYMFYLCRVLTSLDVSGWDTGNVTDMNRVFYKCGRLTSLDVSEWNTGNVTTMYGMFEGCTRLTNLDVSGWDTGNVTDMNFMFAECSSLTSLDVGRWNTKNVKHMHELFYECSSLTSLDVSRWDTGNVEYTSDMFSNCYNLTSLDVSGWDTRYITYMVRMFYKCSSLTSLDVSRWNTGNVTTMSDMFYNCASLTSLDLSGWNMGNVENEPGSGNMFYNCSGLMTLKTPRRLSAIAISLPDVFFDPIGRKTNLLTPEFCSTTLTRLRPLTLTGSITGHQGVAYASVTARLVGLDGTAYRAEVTGADSLDGTEKKECSYSVQAPAGQYSLEVEAETQGGVKVNRSIVVKLSADGQTKDVNLPNGQAKTKVEAKNGANALVSGLDALILESDDTLMGGASTAEVMFTIDSAENLKSGTEAAAIQSAAPAQTMEFYDFSILKTVDGTESRITDTGSAVTIVLPFEKKGKSNVKVYRYHGGTVDTLTEKETGGEKIAVDEESITIYAKKFSVYALGYTVSANEGAGNDDNPGGTSGNPGSAGGSSSISGNTGSGTYGTTSDSDASYGRPVSRARPVAIQPAAGAGESNAFLKPQNVDWKNVLTKVNAAQGGENVNVLTGGSFTVPEEIIRVLAGTDKTLALQLGHGTAASLSGWDVRRVEAGAAPSLTFAETADIPETAKRFIVQDAQAVRELAVQPTGAFPYLFNLHFALGAENAGKRVYFYRYDAKGGRLSLAGSMCATAGGQAMFALKEGGGYLVAVAKSATRETYTVARGDTIFKIAASHGVSPKALLAANPHVRNSNQIYPGQVLRIPGC